MKRCILFIIIALLIATGCTQIPPKECWLVRFQVTTGDQMRARHTIEDAHSLLVSIEDSEGGTVHDMKSILLYRMGEGFVSEPMALELGDYQLTEFLVLNDQGDAIFATPKEGTEPGTMNFKYSVSDDTMTITWDMNGDGVYSDATVFEDGTYWNADDMDIKIVLYRQE